MKLRSVNIGNNFHFKYPMFVFFNLLSSCSKRLVPTTSFTLHSTHCERFIQICSKCQEPFPKSQLEEHENEVHKEINCKDCNQKLEMKDQINHLVSFLISPNILLLRN